MICKKCRQDFIGFFSCVCPYCGFDNDQSFFGIFDLDEDIDENINDNSYNDEYNWDNPDNCSDDEYMDDDDYDDFDN